MPLPSLPRPARRRSRRGLRRWLRRPFPFWFAAFTLTALTVSTVARVTGAAVDERDRWGRRVPAVVAVRDLEPGDVLDAESVEVQWLPAAVVPAGALSDAAGEVVAAWIAGGEVVVTRRLAPAGLSAVAARLPAGTRGVAVPQGLAPLPVTVGDRVDVLATIELSTATIATDAVVVSVTDDAVTVALRDREADRVAGAVTSATVTLVLSATSSRR